MTQERLSMRKIREVLRLKFESGLSHRAIARSCAISHSTVREYIHRARTAGLSWPLPEGLDEDQLDRLPRNLHLGFLFPTPPSPSGRTIPACPGGQAREPDWKAIHTELRRKGVTLRLLWLEYRRTRPDGYGYSWFCECYRLWAKTLNPPMRLTHKAGEKLFVDPGPPQGGLRGSDPAGGRSPNGGDPPGPYLRRCPGRQQLHLRRSSSR